MGLTAARKLRLGGLLLLSSTLALARLSTGSPLAGSPQAATPAARSIGTIKAIQGNSVTLAPDSGAAITVLVQDSTRILRVEPGQKTLQGATPVRLEDLQVGDRILVRGNNAADAASLTATSVVLMKKSDIQQKQQQEEQEWQKNGTGGLVKSADANTGAIMISTGVGPTARTVTVITSKGTAFRRYASNSVKFSDSTPGTFDQIKPGDQLRALGTRSADGGSLSARDVVSGSFRNIAGTVISVDAQANEVSVNDLLTKRPVQVKLTPDSTIRKLPPMMAQMIATRLKGTGGGPQGSTPASGGGGAASGRPDFQQFLNRLPQATLVDLQKGDAVMIVSTESSAAITAITLLSGVEPILTAAPNSNQAASFMSGWTLGGGGGGGGEGGDTGP